MIALAASASVPALAEGENHVMAATDANKLVVSNFIEAVWREGRVDRLPEFWTADCINHADPAPKNEGLDALKKYHEGFAHSFVDFEGTDIALEQQVAENDRVVTQMVTHAVHKPTGRHVTLATIRIDRITNGKIAEHWSVADMAGLMKQLA